MTKARAPLTCEHALTKIAGEIGWDRVAEIAGQAPRTVRNWSDPDTKPEACDVITLGLGLKLDAAYRAAGGQGAPILQCLAMRLEAETLAAMGDGVAIAAAAARAAKEHGEAISATIAAAQPGATPKVLARAELELEESIAASMDTLAAIRAGRTGGVQQDQARAASPAGSSPGGEQ